MKIWKLKWRGQHYLHIKTNRQCHQFISRHCSYKTVSETELQKLQGLLKKMLLWQDVNLFPISLLCLLKLKNWLLLGPVHYRNPSLKYITSDDFLIHERLPGQLCCLLECRSCPYWKVKYFQPSFASRPTFSLISPSFVFPDQAKHFLNAVPHFLLQAVSKRHWHGMSCETTLKKDLDRKILATGCSLSVDLTASKFLPYVSWMTKSS